MRMTSPSEGGVAAAGGIAELGGEAQRARTSYAGGALSSKLPEAMQALMEWKPIRESCCTAPAELTT